MALRGLDVRRVDGRPQVDRYNSVLGPLLFAVFMRALPLTMVGPLLPSIARSLGADLATVGWIVATYASGSLVAQPVMGRLSDVRGRRTILLWCITLFAAGSLWCALSVSLWALIVGRMIQALGAGGIQPVVTAIVGEQTEEQERGGALGAMYAMFGLGTMAGALVGGAAVDGALFLSRNASIWPVLRAELASFPWHAVFWINVVLAAIAFRLALTLSQKPDLRSGAAARRSSTIDVVGVACVLVFTVFVMGAATTQALTAAAYLGGAAVCVAALVIWEKRSTAPLFDPDLFENGTGFVYVIALLFGVPSFTLTIYSATYFIARFGASAAQSGLALFGLATLYAIGAVVGGRAVRSAGEKPPLATGLVLAGIGLLALMIASSALGAAAAMALGGFGLGLVSAPPNALILKYVPPNRAGAATGVASLCATSGSVTAPAAVSAFLHYRLGSDAANMRPEFLLGAALCALCAILVAALPRGNGGSASKAGDLEPGGHETDPSRFQAR